MNFYDYRVSSPYGVRTDPFTGKFKTHNGIDFALPLNTEVFSNVSGTVTKTNYEKDGFGNYVVIKDGTGKLHYYAHLNSDNVDVGDTISIGDSIGFSGSTGRSTGAHLHYEVRDNGSSINPKHFITTGTNSSSGTNNTSDIPSIDDTAWYDVKGKIKVVVFNIFKFIVIALLVVLFVIFITKALDISIF